MVCLSRCDAKSTALHMKGVLLHGVPCCRFAGSKLLPTCCTYPMCHPALQAALQSKRLELRAAVADGLRAVFQQQQQRQQGRQAAAAAGGRTGDEGDQPDEEAVWVHNGFLDAYASVRSEVMRLLETALAGGTSGGEEGVQE